MKSVAWEPERNRGRCVRARRGLVDGAAHGRPARGIPARSRCAVRRFLRLGLYTPSHHGGWEKGVGGMGSGVIVGLFSWSASGPERRLQTEPRRYVGLPALRTERLASPHAAKHRLRLFRAERPVDTGRPISRTFDRPRRQGRSLCLVVGPTSGETPPSPLLRALDQVRPQGVAFDVAEVPQVHGFSQHPDWSARPHQ